MNRHIDDFNSSWVITPRPAGLGLQFDELRRFKHLFFFFCRQAVKRQYRRTALGVMWVFLRPLIAVCILALLFGGLLGVDSGPIPYFLFLLVGYSIWQLFELATMWATRCLELNRRLLKQLYFPRLLLPASYIAPALVEFGIRLALIVFASCYYWFSDGKWYLRGGEAILVAIGAVVCCLILAIGIGLWTSVWAATYRDIRFTLRYILQFWFYLTPVLYPSSLIPDSWQMWSAINPLAAYVEAFKWGMLGMGEVGYGQWIGAICITGVVTAGGLWFFTRAESAALDRL